MKYMGSKNRLSKDLLPIIQEYINKNKIKQYVEPFVGGANMIDKIKCNVKVGFDNNKYLIALLDYVSKNGMGDFPVIITKEHYSEVRKSFNNNDDEFSDYYKGYIGFMGSYNGRFFDGGYSGHEVMEKGKTKPRDFISQTINNLKQQIPNIKDVGFKYADFNDLNFSNSVIYCDPPYKNTKKYSTSKDFDHDLFYDWCRKQAKDNIVIISEYEMPNDFECIWEKKMKTNLMNTQNNKRKDKVEKLFMLNN